MTGCQEPRCEEYATFVISHDVYRYPFCTQHVWSRVHKWLYKIPNGERVCVEKINQEKEEAPTQRRTVRDMRSDNTAGQLVVSRARDLESTEGSPKGTNQTVTPGEMPAMRKPTRKRGTKVPVRIVNK